MFAFKIKIRSFLGFEEKEGDKCSNQKSNQTDSLPNVVASIDKSKLQPNLPQEPQLPHQLLVASVNTIPQLIQTNILPKWRHQFLPLPSWKERKDISGVNKIPQSSSKSSRLEILPNLQSLSKVHPNEKNYIVKAKLSFPVHDVFIPIWPAWTSSTRTIPNCERYMNHSAVVSNTITFKIALLSNTNYLFLYPKLQHPYSSLVLNQLQLDLKPYVKNMDFNHDADILVCQFKDVRMMYSLLCCKNKIWGSFFITTGGVSETNKVEFQNSCGNTKHPQLHIVSNKKALKMLRCFFLQMVLYNPDPLNIQSLIRKMMFIYKPKNQEIQAKSKKKRRITMTKNRNKNGTGTGTGTENENENENENKSKSKTENNNKLRDKNYIRSVQNCKGQKAAHKEVKKRLVQVQIYGISSIIPPDILVPYFKSLGELTSYSFAPVGKRTRFHVVSLKYFISKDKSEITSKIDSNLGTCS